MLQAPMLEGATGGAADIVHASTSYSLAGRFVETLQLTGTANIDTTGNSQVNTLLGNDGSVANDSSDRIIYDSATGALYFDADGNAAGSQIQFASLATGLALTSADFLLV